MLLVLCYWAVMVLFYIIASKLGDRKDKFTWVNTAINLAVYFVCLIMGLRMGSNEEITSSLSTIGVQSVIVTVLCVTGSMFFVFLTRKLVHMGKDGRILSKDEIKMMKDRNTANGPEGDQAANPEENTNSENTNSDSLKFTLMIIFLVAAGMAAGYFIVPVAIGIEIFTDISSKLLVFGTGMILATVGFSLGLSGDVFKNIKTAGYRVIFFPFAAILGSLAMGIIYGLIGPLTVREAMAVSMGFGWYTFAPGVIIDAGHAVCGAISFMHNVLRETLGIIIIPLATKKFGSVEAAAIPGVAAMDICMPIVERSNQRPEIVIYSFAIGLVMCLAVPTLVPLFIG